MFPSIHLHAALLSPGSSPTYRIFPLAKIFTFLYPGHLLFIETLQEPFILRLSRMPGPHFPQYKQSIGRSKTLMFMCMVVLSHVSSLIAGLRIFHFCFVQVLPKFTTSWYQLQLVSGRLLSEVQLQTFIPTHIHPTICPARFHNLRHFFCLGQKLFRFLTYCISWD